MNKKSIDGDGSVPQKNGEVMPGRRHNFSILIQSLLFYAEVPCR